MSLLREIQNDAASSSVPVASMLRKCRILAGRLRNEELTAWVSHELNGYPAGVPLPEYRRGVRGHLVADVSNVARGYQNAPLPETSIPEEFRENLLVNSFNQPVAELEELVAEGSDLRRRVPAELWGYLEEELNGYSVLDARIVLSRAAIVGIIDQIRTRALEFAVEIEAIDADAGEGLSSDAPAISQSEVIRVFNNTVYGGNVNVAVGNRDVQQEGVGSVAVGDFEALSAVLVRAGVTQEEIEDLSRALETDGDSDEVGDETKGWLQRVTGRLAATGATVGMGAASQVVGLAVASYLGIGVPPSIG